MRLASLSRVGAGDRRFAGARRDQRGQHAQRRRLAGAVRAEEAEDLAFADAEVDAAHGFDGAALGAERLPEVMRLDDRRHEDRAGWGRAVG
jgi:hypothetical protein